MSTITVKKKKAISGFIRPRWTKDKVAFWLEVGAIPAIIGLWFPDWLGSYSHGAIGHIPPLLPALPPLLTYVGAIILLKACYEGIKDMGSHFTGLRISGGLALFFALASVPLSLGGLQIISLLATGLAGFFSAGFFWFTIGKVADVTQETRTRVTWHAVWILSILSLLVYGAGIIALLTGKATLGYTILRFAVGILTVDFFFCRYAVHCYKTQTSIGARFSEAPDNQFWAGSEK
jgi:hypothetical protein